jgi:hypothetical protein
MFALRHTTQYERGVIHEIAAWKRSRPGSLGHLADVVSRPVARVLNQVIPESAIRTAITSAYAASTWMTSPTWLNAVAGGVSLKELRTKSLKLSDELAQKTGDVSQISALVNGALTGAGGVLLAPADVATLTIIALNCIRRTGHCYGYPLDRPDDRPYVLAILMLSATRDPTERHVLLGRIEDFPKWAVAQTIEAAAIDGLIQPFAEITGDEAVPGIGAFLGSASNFAFIHRVRSDAQRVFQERWLRENGRLGLLPWLSWIWGLCRTFFRQVARFCIAPFVTRRPLEHKP